MLVTYFAIQSSFGVVLFTYGFLFSLGEAIAYAPPLFCAIKVTYAGMQVFVNTALLAAKEVIHIKRKTARPLTPFTN